MSVQVYGCNHVAIEVDDIEKAVAFYKDVFNLEQMSEGEGDAFFKLGEHQFLAIFEVEKAQRANMRHFGIMVRDEAQLAEVRKKLTEKYKIKLDPTVPVRFSRSVGQSHPGCRSPRRIAYLALALPRSAKDWHQIRREMISFIVPAHNEEFELSSTLAAIHAAASGAAQPYEIIVVDDASTDTTTEIAAQAGAKVIRINRRQIAAARNAGGRAAQGEYLFFIDADTRINDAHVTGAIAAMEAGYAGGSARVNMDGLIPIWGRMLLFGFSSVYFRLNLGAGAFLFTTRRNFDMVGGFDEQYFAGEEVYFSLELKKLGRFKVLREPIVTSGRKLRMYPAKHFLRKFFGVIVRGPRGVRSRAKLSLWYDGKREERSA